MGVYFYYYFASNNFSSIMNDFVANELDGRLLCASTCAYDIANPYFQGAGYLDGTKIRRISRGVNSVIIGKTIDGIVLSFRGTLVKSPIDWLQNAAVLLTDVDKQIPGRIHLGFYKAVKSLWKSIKETTLDWLQEYNNITIRPTNITTSTTAENNSGNSNKNLAHNESCNTKPKIYLTGHSKGGAMASLAAIFFTNDPNLPDPHYVATFGSARLGDDTFRDHFNQKINQTTYENYLDLIPFLPLADRTMNAMGDDMIETVNK